VFRDGLGKALCILFGLVFAPPFVGLADRSAWWIGVPPAVAYLFGGWALLVAALCLVSRRP